MGRQKTKRTRIVGVRFTAGEYAAMENRLKGTDCRKLSEYVRNMVLSKAIAVQYRNASLDECMLEMISLRTELNALGQNFNQAVRKLHMLREVPELRHWIISSEAQRENLLEKTTEIRQCIEKIAAEWLR
ncbi:plasmid mobilization protein [Flavobacterium sp. 1355]|jgi:hypothetical protein|uniref:plasmid mobilization protein n=1 Tax=Flavobacterium sp. 1355 TaxID=2806571 RepID=UPI001AE438CD|nr:plasmid mobilization relaxosome protein MobC [Flavobacterium sp. 1355]MBP1223141.1 hypothetical protein [Flavobacterium sp. 1355]